MQKTWVVAAESTRAKIYQLSSKTSPLQEIEDLIHTSGREKILDLEADRPGRAFDSVGGGRHALGKEVDSKEHEALVFAKILVDRIEQGRTATEFTDLILIAPPEFMGHFKKTLNSQLLKLVSKTLTKNLVRENESVIRDHLFE